MLAKLFLACMSLTLAAQVYMFWHFRNISAQHSTRPIDPVSLTLSAIVIICFGVGIMAQLGEKYLKPMLLTLLLWEVFSEVQFILFPFKFYISLPVGLIAEILMIKFYISYLRTAKRHQK